MLFRSSARQPTTGGLLQPHPCGTMKSCMERLTECACAHWLATLAPSASYFEAKQILLVRAGARQCTWCRGASTCCPSR